MPDRTLAVALATALALCAVPANAQVLRTFVSGLGSDSNACSLGSPCRTLQRAVSQTGAGGEITVLDSAGYGPVAIDHALSIFAPDGVEAGITTTAAGDGVAVNAAAGDTVNLHGLTISGGGIGTNGITLNSAHVLIIQNCTVRGFTGDGILLAPPAASSGDRYAIIGSTISNNASDGIYFGPTAGKAKVTLFLQHDYLIENVNGLHASGGASNFAGAVYATADAVSAIGNTTGFYTTTLSFLTLKNSIASENNTGIAASGATQVTLQNNILSMNGLGYQSSSGAVGISYGGNFFDSNTNDYSGPLPTAKSPF